MKKLISLILALMLLLALSGCGCEHEWADADCVNPVTCKLCDETEGMPLGHVWIAATCETAKTCEVCGAAEGDPKGHSWVEATCEEAKHCESCNLTEGEALGHSWLDATTEAPKTCETCALTEGDRIITDPRFNTTSTAELQGKWALEIPMTGEMMDMEDFEGTANINMIMTFGNAGDLDITVEVGDQFVDVITQYTIDSLYAEFANQGMNKEEADAGFEGYYGMSIQEYVEGEMAMVDFNALYETLFNAAGLGGVYYVEDGLLYVGDNWEAQMDGSAFTLEGDTLVIDDLAEEMPQELNIECKLVRITEE